MKTYNTTYTLATIAEVAQACLAYSQHHSLLFYGEMGVGKTTLIKEIVKLLGSHEEASSPTYSIVNEYATDKCTIYHFDFYRIHHEEEVYDIGFEDYFQHPEDWQLMEWPSKIPHLLPHQYTQIELDLDATGKRILNLTNVG